MPSIQSLYQALGSNHSTPFQRPAGVIGSVTHAQINIFGDRNPFIQGPVGFVHHARQDPGRHHPAVIWTEDELHTQRLSQILPSRLHLRRRLSRHQFPNLGLQRIRPGIPGRPLNRRRPTQFQSQIQGLLFEAGSHQVQHHPPRTASLQCQAPFGLPFSVFPVRNQNQIRHEAAWDAQRLGSIQLFDDMAPLSPGFQTTFRKRCSPNQ